MANLSHNTVPLDLTDRALAMGARPIDTLPHNKDGIDKQLLALDALAKLSKVHRRDSRYGRTDEVLRTIRQCLSPLLTIECCGLFTLEGDDAFTLAAQWPVHSDELQKANELQEEVDELILRGDFTWSVNRSQPKVIVSSLSGRTLMLSLLTTRKQVQGLFVAVVKNALSMTELIGKTIIVVMNNCAYAIENAALYSIVSGQRDNLKLLVKHRTRELKFTSKHDLLTGLRNRSELLCRLEEKILSAPTNTFAFMHLDIDGLARVNVAYSYKVGDRLLVEVASRLRRFFKQVCDRQTVDVLWSDITVARLGADEFGVLFPLLESMDADQLEPLTTDLLNALNRHYRVDDEQIRISFRIGACLFPQHGDDPKALMMRSEVALHQAKRSGMRYQLYNAGLQDLRGSKSLSLEGELAQAIDKEELFVCYQPKVDLLSGDVVGAEALLRWQHPKRGLISPDEFIPVAENSGLIQPIGEWVFNHVCQQLRSWQQQGHAIKKYSVNLSQMQMQQNNLVNVFADTLDCQSVPANWLEFEVTETSLTHDIDAATRVLGELHDLGFAVSMDDFGTGHSSLTLLKKFPLDTIKIDQSFVRDLTSDPDDAAIVNAVVTMANNLRLRVVAEGVETRDQLHFLRAMGCHEVQGYYTGRPVVADDFIKLCSDWRGFR